MALQISETWPSGAGNAGRDGDDEYSAFVMGDPNPDTDNADDPRTVALFAMAEFVLISPLNNVLTTIGRERLAPGLWLITAKYVSSTENRQEGDASFSYSVGGGTQHITHAKATIGTYVPQSTGTSGTTSSTTAPDFQGAINVTDDGVQGVDIGAKTSAFDVTFYIAPKNMTTSYDQMVDQYQQCVNSDVVTINIDGITRTYQAGELLYDQGTGSKRKGTADWEINLKCKVSKNATNITIGGTTDSSGNTTGAIVIPQKNGWDLLWVRSGPQTFPASNSTYMTQVPKAATVVRVYDYVPLSPLFAPTGFGTPGQPGQLSWQQPTDGSAGSTGIAGSEGAGDGGGGGDDA